MSHKLIPQRALFRLIAAAALLLTSGFVAFGLGELLVALGDALGGRVLKYIALGLAALFVVDLICLILVQAINSLAEPEDPPDTE
ncbi:MAG: hypothetical protein ABIP48_11930 [Planctomycetota bacterium]